MVVAVLGSLRRFVRLVFARIGLLAVSGDRRDAEILALRHQLLVLQHQVARPSFTEADRTILAVLARTLDRSRLSEVMLMPLVSQNWTGAPSRARPQPRPWASGWT
jgi:hypothetical protein